MEARSRASTVVFEAPPLASGTKAQRPSSSSDSGMNNSTSLLKAPTETLASNEPPLEPTDPHANKTIYDFQVLNCYHELYDLSQHKGSVVLICNVASKDKEYTEAAYTTLTKLYRKYHHEGFVVLAFPCNEFGNAEPGNEDEIAENLSCVYPRIGEVDFPIMAKVEVNGDHALPLFTYLKSRIRGTLGQTSVKWNFTSFVVDQAGLPFARFAPGSTFSEIDARVQALLHPPLPPPPPPAAAEPEAAGSAPLSDTQSEAAAGKAAPDDTPTPDEFSGRATPPPSEVAQLKADASAAKEDAALVRVRGSSESPELEEEPAAAGREGTVENASSSALLNATTMTVEGSNM